MNTSRPAFGDEQPHVSSRVSGSVQQASQSIIIPQKRKVTSPTLAVAAVPHSHPRATNPTSNTIISTGGLQRHQNYNVDAFRYNGGNGRSKDVKKESDGWVGKSPLKVSFAGEKKPQEGKQNQISESFQIKSALVTGDGIIDDEADSGNGGTSSSDTDAPSTKFPPNFTLPFPKRPGSHNPPRAKSKASYSSSSRGLAQNLGLEMHQLLSSASALALTKKDGDGKNSVPPRTAGFYPWTGNHPEDSLSEHAIKFGNFDKLPTSDAHQQLQRETASARSFIWPQLKAKPGLQTLSSVFVTAMEKRQERRYSNAVVALRPPPRVTLTEQKREVWLRDLANPARELRKLSKSIPHGIRGKALMEQCLAKKIPPARAVWFAKCVGANELRAFKRKSASGHNASGGESKWVREWTVQVGQFVEDVIAQCGQPDWAAKMNYTLSLAAHLFEHRLLDRDHHLDWLLSSLENSPLGSLPVWLFMIRIYWRYLTRYSKFGSRLAEALLARLEGVDLSFLKLSYDEEHEEANRSLKGSQFIFGQIRKLVIALVVMKRECFITPQSWQKHNDVLCALAEHVNDTRITSAVKDVKQRNVCVDVRYGAFNEEKKRKDIIYKLDSSESPYNTNTLAKECLSGIAYPEEAIILVLRWATTLYREGCHRLYLATRLLRIWHRQGVDTDGAILAFILNQSGKCRFEDVYQLVGNLTRSGDFSAERYLRWLIARGSLLGSAKSRRDDKLPCHVELLSELSLQGLPEHVLNLRRSQLNAAGTSIEQESKELVAVKGYIMQQMPGIFHVDAVSGYMDKSILMKMSTTTKFAASSWLRGAILSVMTPGIVTEKDDDTNTHGTNITLRPEDFYTLMDIFEKLGDYPVLADILNICTSSSNPIILTGISNTLQLHHETFSCIGAFKKLSRALLDRLREHLRVHPPDRMLVTSLLELESYRSLRNPQFISELTALLSRCDQGLVGAVCSPASDSLGDVAQTGDLVDEEIDAVLASGTNMDEQLHARLFGKIMSDFERQVGSKMSGLASFCRWLPLLRAFDRAGFDKKLHIWALNVLRQRKHGVLMKAVHFLTAVGCFNITGITVVVNEHLGAIWGDMEKRAETMLFYLETVFRDGQDSELSLQHSHTFALIQNKYTASNRQLLLRMLRQVFDLIPQDADRELRSKLQGVLASRRLISFWRSAALHEEKFADAIKLSSAFKSKYAERQIQMMLAKLLSLTGDTLFIEKSLSNQVSEMIMSSDELSLPFCRLYVRYLSISQGHDSERHDSDLPILSEAAFEATKLAIEQGNHTWSEMLSGVRKELAPRVREYAEEKIYSITQKSLLQLGQEHSEHVAPSQDLTQNLHKYINAIVRVMDEKSQPNTSTLLMRLKSLVEVPLANFERRREKTNECQTNQKEIFSACVRALLRLSLLYKDNLLDTKAAAELVGIASMIGLLLLRPCIRFDRRLCQFVHDAGLLFVKDFTIDSRAQVLRKITFATTTVNPTTMSALSEDPDLSFIFGSLPGADTWPGIIMTNQPVSSVSSSTASGATTSISTSSTQVTPTSASAPGSMTGMLSTPTSATASALTPTMPSPMRSYSGLSSSSSMSASQSQYQQTTPHPYHQQQQQHQRQQQQRQSPPNSQPRHTPFPPLQHPLPTPPPSQRQSQQQDHRLSQTLQQQQQQQSPNTALPANHQHAHPHSRPFTLKRWDVLPDMSFNMSSAAGAAGTTATGAGNTGGKDGPGTASDVARLGMGMFAARRV